MTLSAHSLNNFSKAKSHTGHSSRKDNISLLSQLDNRGDIQEQRVCKGNSHKQSSSPAQDCTERVDHDLIPNGR
jgi:hypothetical protein